MKIIHILLWFFIALFALSCEKDDNPIKEEENPIEENYQVFTFITDEHSIHPQDRCWVLIYDDNDILIASDEFENSSTIELELDPLTNDSLYTVKLVRVGFLSMDVSTYISVEPATWMIDLNKGYFDDGVIDPIGEIKVNTSDFSLNDYSKNIVQSMGDRYHDTYNPSIVDQCYDPDKLWLSFYNKGENAYFKLVDEVSLNSSFNFTLADFNIMEDYVDIELPSNIKSYSYLYSADSYGEVNPGFSIYSNNIGEAANSVRIYYPGNLFSRYVTSLSILNESCDEIMVVKGENVASEFIQLNIESEVENSSILNFRSTITGSADCVTYIWSCVVKEEMMNADYTCKYWVYAEPETNFNYEEIELPDFILEQIPATINLNELSLDYTNFDEYDYLNGFADYVSKKFGPVDYEYDNSVYLFKHCMNNK